MLGDWKTERINHLQRAMFEGSAPPDILCVQELFSLSAGRRQRIVSIAAASGLTYHKSDTSSFRHKALIDGGCAVFSRFPLLHFSTRVFKHAVGDDRLAAKMVNAHSRALTLEFK